MRLVFHLINMHEQLNHTWVLGDPPRSGRPYVVAGWLSTEPPIMWVGTARWDNHLCAWLPLGDTGAGIYDIHTIQPEWWTIQPWETAAQWIS